MPDRDVVLARYRALAPFYDATCVRISVVRDCATSVVAARPGETIVDVGCGTGAMLPGLMAQVGNRGRVIGIEQWKWSRKLGLVLKAIARAGESAGNQDTMDGSRHVGVWS